MLSDQDVTWCNRWFLPHVFRTWDRGPLFCSKLLVLAYTVNDLFNYRTWLATHQLNSGGSHVCEFL